MTICPFSPTLAIPTNLFFITPPSITCYTFHTNYNNYEDFNVSQDDNKIEFQEENSKIIYYYQGDKITGYESYITFDSKEVAEVAVKAFNDGSNPNIEKAYVDDKSVVIVYNEKAYQSKSLEDIKNEYEHVIKVKNGDYKYKN